MEEGAQRQGGAAGEHHSRVSDASAAAVAAVGGGGRDTGVRGIPLQAVAHGPGSNSRHWLRWQVHCPTSEGAEPARACWLLPPRWGNLAGPRRRQLRLAESAARGLRDSRGVLRSVDSVAATGCRDEPARRARRSAFGQGFGPVPSPLCSVLGTRRQRVPVRSAVCCWLERCDGRVLSCPKLPCGAALNRHSSPRMPCAGYAGSQKRDLSRTIRWKRFPFIVRVAHTSSSPLRWNPRRNSNRRSPGRPSCLRR